MSNIAQTTETAASMTAKASAPITVSLATVAGYQVSEILLWCTLVYTVLMIAHKLYSIYKDVTTKQP
jgi:beta-lactamase regulating signal transducer with metallopeptidase domain